MDLLKTVKYCSYGQRDEITDMLLFSLSLCTGLCIDTSPSPKAMLPKAMTSTGR